MSAAVPRKWHTFPGKNKFFCDGRIVTSNQQSVFLLTLFLIIGVTVLFFVFDSPYLAEKLSLAIPIIDGVVFLFLMLFLFRTSWTDPGIIPRATPDEAIYNEKQIDRMILSDIYQPPRTMEVIIKGIPTKLKFCTTCKIFRPPRASHCSVCDNCVERFDHHCPWVGNCIGKRNYRYFYWFLVLVTINCCYILAFSVTTLVLRSIQSDFVDALKKSPGSIIEAVVCFIALWSVVGLTGFHTFLASCNITTNEDIKNLYSKSGQKNPFSRGSVTKNYCEIICGPLSPSLIDSRGIPVDQSTVLFPTNLTPQNPNSTSQLVMPSRPLPNSNYFFTPHKTPPAPALYQENARGMSLTRHNNNPTKLYPDVVTTQDVGSVSISQIGEAI